MTWLGYASLSALFAGLVAILGKLGLQGVDSLTATTLRALVMAVFMLLVASATGVWRQVGGLSATALVYVTLSGMAGALSWICFFKGLGLGQAIQVSSVDRLSGVVTLVLAVALLGERVSPGVLLGTLLMVIGGVLVARG